MRIRRLKEGLRKEGKVKEGVVIVEEEEVTEEEEGATEGGEEALILKELLKMNAMDLVGSSVVPNEIQLIALMTLMMKDLLLEAEDGVEEGSEAEEGGVDLQEGEAEVDFVEGGVEVLIAEVEVVGLTEADGEAEDLVQIVEVVADFHVEVVEAEARIGPDFQEEVAEEEALTEAAVAASQVVEEEVEAPIGEVEVASPVEVAVADFQVAVVEMGQAGEVEVAVAEAVEEGEEVVEEVEAGSRGTKDLTKSLRYSFVCLMFYFIKIYVHTSSNYINWFYNVRYSKEKTLSL
jgi:hypothetical protein